MSFTYQRSAQSSGTSVSVDVGVQSNDRLIVVFVGAEKNDLGSGSVGSVAVVGKSFTHKETVNTSSGNGLHLEMFTIDESVLDTVTGSQTITFTPNEGVSANWGIHAQVWYGSVDGDDIFFSGNNIISSGTSITVYNLDHYKNSMVIMGALNSGSPLTDAYSSWSNGLIEKTDGTPAPSNANLATASVAKSNTATGQNFTATAPNNVKHVAIAAVFTSELPSESPSESLSESASLSPSSSESPSESLSESSSESLSESPSLSPSSSESPSESLSESPSESLSESPSLSPSASESPSESISESPSESLSESPSLSPSASESPSESASESASESLSESSSESPSESLSESSSESPSLSPSASESPSESLSESPSESASESSSLSSSASESPSESPSISPSASESPSESSSISPSASESPSESSSLSPSASESPSESLSESPSESPSESLSESPSESASESPSLSSSASESPSESLSISPSASESPSESASISPSQSESPSESLSESASESASESSSLSPSASESPSESPSESLSESASESSSLSPSASESPSESKSESPSESPSVSFSESSSESASESPSESLSESASESPSESLSESASESPSESPSESLSESPSLSPGSEGLYFKRVESDASSSNLTDPLIEDSFFESTNLTTLPDTFTSSEYQKELFTYSFFDFDVIGGGSDFWNTAGIPTGIGGLERYGVGAFYFYVPVNQLESVDPVDVTLCEEEVSEKRNFWDYLTTFWNFLMDDDRDMFENYWHGLVIAGDSLIKKAERFYELMAPENARTCVLDDYYDIQIGPLYSKPINLNPTKTAPTHTINPIGKILLEPVYVNNEPYYYDLIEIQANDYHKIRSVGLDAYVVIQVKNDDISDKFFKINNLKSSEEPQDTAVYAEIDESVNEGGDDLDIGKLAIEAAIQSEDISEYKITIGDNGATATSVTWGTDTLDILVKTNPADSDEIQSIIDATPTGETPWATFTNKSGYNLDDGVEQKKSPLFTTAVKVKELYNYKNLESANGRYYPISGKTWKWYEGYSSSNATEGTFGKGEWTDDTSKMKYMIEVDGDLSYINDNSFSIYLTTGRAYDVENYIISLPTLQTFIDPDKVPEFVVDNDYTFGNYIVEFNENIFDNLDIDINKDNFLYCPKVPIIEHMLFEVYGTLVNNSDWNNYNYDNFSGKAAINGLLKSIQNSSNREDYERALNIYYGMPIAPEDCKVIGLYESYGYKVIEIVNNLLTLELNEGEDLHEFVQAGGKFFVEGKKDLFINVVNNRELGTITVDDASNIVLGDRLHIKLDNRFSIKKILKEGHTISTDSAAVDIYTSNGNRAISHLIDVINATSNEEIYPEMIIYGTEDMEVNYNGIYHITNAAVVEGGSGQVVRLYLYKAANNEDPLYNDYIGTSSPEDMNYGFVHIPWPTHKFLYLLLNGNEYFKAYLDAPIDTIFEEGDKLSKYQRIARNVSVVNKTMFPGWYQFDKFRKFHGLDYQSDLVELIKSTPGATFGDYFPNRYEQIG